MSYKHLKLKLRVFLAGHIVAMVTYWATKLTANCSPMIGQFVDTTILVSTRIEWLLIITHQTLSLQKYWKLLSATLKAKKQRRSNQFELGRCISVLKRFFGCCCNVLFGLVCTENTWKRLKASKND